MTWTILIKSVLMYSQLVCEINCRYWFLLLVELLPMLETSRDLFSASQIYELMNALCELQQTSSGQKVSRKLQVDWLELSLTPIDFVWLHGFILSSTCLFNSDLKELDICQFHFCLSSIQGRINFTPLLGALAIVDDTFHMLFLQKLISLLCFICGVLWLFFL